LKSIRAAAALVGAIAITVWLGGCKDAGEQATSSNAEDRLQAIHALADRNDDASVQRLAEASRHEDVRTATEAMSSLGRVRHPEASRALVQAATTDQRAPMRQLAVRTIGERRDMDSAPVVRQILLGDADPRVKAEAAAALGRIGTLDDVDLLTNVATNTKDVLLQSRSVAAIERLLHLRFDYSPTAPESERQRAVARLAAAPDLARQLKAIRAAGGLKPPPGIKP
jgi:HEAT repeat protein